MDERVRYRVIGAVVIGAFLILLSPIVLKKRAQVLARHQSIPYMTPKAAIDVAKHDDADSEEITHWQEPLPVAHVSLDKPAKRTSSLNRLPQLSQQAKQAPPIIKAESLEVNVNREPKSALPAHVSLKAPKPIQQVAFTPAVSQTKQAPKVKPHAPSVVVKKAKPKRVASNNPKALKRPYSVRLAAFGEPRNAYRLKNKLEKMGFDAFVQSMTNKQNVKLSLVFVGHLEDKNRAKTLQHNLMEKIKLKGLVVRQ